MLGSTIQPQKLNTMSNLNMLDLNAKAKTKANEASDKYSNQLNNAMNIVQTVGDLGSSMGGMTGKGMYKDLGNQQNLTQGLMSGLTKNKQQIPTIKNGLNKIKIKKQKYKYKVGAGAVVGQVTQFTDVISDKLVGDAEKEDGGVNATTQSLGTALKGAGAGAKIGGMFGPVGMGIGAAIGGIGGAIGGALNASARNRAVVNELNNSKIKANTEQTNARVQKAFLDDMKTADNPNFAKKGLSKLKAKYNCGNIKLKYKMKNGVREILTEDREAHFVKNKGKYTLLNNPNKPITHENNKNEGRNAVVVPKSKYKLKDIVNHNMSVSNNPKDSLILPEGSSIITAKKGLNKLALKAYQKGNYKMIDKIVNNMPKDKVDKYFNGDEELEIDSYGYDNTGKAGGTLKEKDRYRENKENEAYRKKIQNDKVFRMSELKKGNVKYTEEGKLHYKPKGESSKNAWEFAGQVKRNIQEDVNILEDKSKKNKLVQDNKSQLDNSTKIEKKPELNSLKIKDNDIANIAKISLNTRISDLNNIREGSKSPRKNEIFNAKYVLKKYQDMSDPTRNEINKNAKVQTKNAYELSAGNVGNARANFNQAIADKSDKIAQVNQNEINRQNEIQNENINIINESEKEKALNLQNKQIQDFQEEDANKTRFQQGLVGVDENNYRNKQDIINQNQNERSNNIQEKSLSIQEEREKAEANQRKLNAQLELEKLKNKKLKGSKKLKLKYKMK